MGESVQIRPVTDEAYVDISLDTLSLGKQALVFVSTKSSAEHAAEEIAKAAKIVNVHATELSEKLHKVLSKPTKQCERLAKCVKGGIAFHHAGLHSKQKELVEDAFRSGVVRIICCTPTLAYGLDMPAFRSIIRDVKRFSIHGSVNIPVLEYLQMAGRAGRPKKDDWGEAILVAKSVEDALDLENMYIHGSPEPIYSKLAVEPVLRTSLLSLIATRFCRTKKDLFDFFSKTFWAHQFRDTARLFTIIERVLGDLESWKFISSPATDDFVSADMLNTDPVYNATPIGARVSELYIDPYTAHGFIDALDKGITLDKIPFYAWLVLVCSALEMRPRLSVGKKDWESVVTKANSISGRLLMREPSVYDPEFDEYLEAVKTGAMLESWAEESDDEFLLETFNVRPGELRAKLELADWLMYSLNELSYVLNYRDLQKDLRNVRMRLRYGVKEELLPLLRLDGVGRVRARKMFKHGIKTISDIHGTDITTLSQLVGPAVAVSIKKQVGEEESEPVPDGRRKGQMGLGKYSEDIS